MTEIIATPQASPLMDFVLGILTPLLMAAGIAGPAAARLAAQEAIEARKAQGETDLLSIVQSIALGLAALDNLRLATLPELSLVMKAKLRGHAAALSRCATEGSRPINDRRPAAREAQTASIPTNTVMVPAPAKPNTRQGWANAMREEAARLQASLPHTNPETQESDRFWIDILREAALDLTQGAAVTTDRAPLSASAAGAPRRSPPGRRSSVR